MYVELDVITLIKSIRQLRLFSQILLSEDQRMLLKYQRSNLIESGSSSSCDSDLEGVDIKDKVIKEHFRNRVKDALSYFEDKSRHLDPIDKRIIAGLIFRKVRETQLISTIKEKFKSEDFEYDEESEEEKSLDTSERGDKSQVAKRVIIQPTSHNTHNRILTQQ